MNNDYIPFGGMEKVVSGYFDANKKGVLFKGGMISGISINFFTAGIDLVGMQPDDALVGNEPFRYNCIRDKE